MSETFLVVKTGVRCWLGLEERGGEVMVGVLLAFSG